MNKNHWDIQERIATALLRAQEQDLPASEQQWLIDQLRDSPLAMTLYLQHIELLSGVFYAARDVETSVRAAQVGFSLGSPDATDSSVVTKPTEDSSLDQLGLNEPIKRRSPLPTLVAKQHFQFSRPLLYYAAVVALCFYGSFVLVAWNLRSVADPDDADPPQVAAWAPAQPSARLTRADDARWQHESSATASDQLEGQTLNVRTGSAELQFAQGAKVVVQGPAEFEVRSPNSGFLRRGKLVALVPREAVGFTIGTPNAEIVDLGTAFGVEVDDQQNAEVHVFKGVVEARQLNSALAQQAGVRVTAGNALRIDSQQLKPTPVAIRPVQQFGVVKQAKIKSIDRDMLVAEWDFLKDQNLTFAANGASRAAKLSGRATVDSGVALGALSGNRQLMSGFLNTLSAYGEPTDRGIITDAKWGELFGSNDLTSGSFVVVFKPNPAQWIRYILMSHVVQVGEFGQIFASFQQNDTNTTSEVMLRVGRDDAQAIMTIPALKKTDWYLLGGSWSPGETSFLYLRNITDGTLCGTAIGNAAVKMKEGAMKGPIHLGLRNSRDKLSESANSLIAYAALLYPYWNTADQFDQFFRSLIDPPDQKEFRSER